MRSAADGGWHLGHLVRKIRLIKGLTVGQLARLSNLSSGEICAVESDESGQAPSLYLGRIKKLETVLGVDFLRAADVLTGRLKLTGQDGTVHPFVSEQHSIHQNSMEWTEDGRLLDAYELAPQFAIVPSEIVRSFIGKKIPTSEIRKMKTFAHTRVVGGAHINDARTSRLSLWGHYQRLINAARDDEETPPLRYNASLVRAAGATRVTREVTAIRLSSGIYETRTHIVRTDKRIDLPCCGSFSSCAECFLRSSTELLRTAIA